MAKPYRMKAIEQEYGEPLETLMPRLLNEYQTITALAPVVNASFGTLQRWCDNNMNCRHLWTLKPEGERRGRRH